MTTARRRLTLTIPLERLEEFLGLEDDEHVIATAFDARTMALALAIEHPTAAPVDDGLEAQRFELAFPRLGRVPTLAVLDELEARVEALIELESELVPTAEGLAEAPPRASLLGALDNIGALRNFLGDDVYEGS